MTARADRPGTEAGVAGDGRPPSAAPEGVVLRPATEAELPACARIWRESINDYTRRLNQPDIPDDLGAILRVYAHLHATDPTRFIVAERPDRSAVTARAGEPAIDAFVVAFVRGRLWFLSMLFVLPRAQGHGLGRALLEAAIRGVEAGTARPTPVAWHATAIDTVQPISNGLYSSRGIVPRTPLLRLVGLPEPSGAFPGLPNGVEATPFDEIDGAADGGGLGRSALMAEVSALDSDALGVERSVDHAFLVAEGRRGFLYHDRTGAAVGYGYTSESGRVGPIAVNDPALLGAVVGHLVTAVRPRGAFGVWVPG